MTRKGTQVIETERLILRRFTALDASDMFNGWAGDAEAVKFLTWSAHSDIGVTETVIGDWLAEYSKNDDFYNWCIEYKQTKTAIGNISAHVVSSRFECAEASYCLSPAYWNRGIMTEALSAVVKFLLNVAGFERVESIHHVNNLASGRVMQKSGMQFEGIKRYGGRKNNGAFCDVRLYAIVKSDLFFN
jgi:RimJ/RimL family protein N-acetyltransferase